LLLKAEIKISAKHLIVVFKGLSLYDYDFQMTLNFNCYIFDHSIFVTNAFNIKPHIFSTVVSFMSIHEIVIIINTYNDNDHFDVKEVAFTRNITIR